jgi:hypothetical protein
MVSNLTFAVLGTTLVVAAGGLGIGTANTLLSDQPGTPLELLGDALTYLPAALAVAGLTTLLVGWVARGAGAAWAAVAVWCCVHVRRGCGLFVVAAAGDRVLVIDNTDIEPKSTAGRQVGGTDPTEQRPSPPRTLSRGIPPTTGGQQAAGEHSRASST